MHEYSFHITSNLFGKSFFLLLAGQRFFLSFFTARQTLPRHLNRFLCLLFALTTTRCFARISWRTTLDYTSPVRCAQLFHHRSFHSQRRQEREERRRRMEAEIAREGTAEPTAASGTDDIAKVLFLSRLVFSHAHRFTFCFATHRLVHWVIALFNFSKRKKILFCISEYKIVNHTFILFFCTNDILKPYFCLSHSSRLCAEEIGARSSPQTDGGRNGKRGRRAQEETRGAPQEVRAQLSMTTVA